MTKELYEWLQHEWKICNLAKYQKYFYSWVDNLTDAQIIGFNKSKNQNLTK